LNEFYEKYRSFILSLSYVLVATVIAGYSILYSSHQVWSEHLYLARSLVQKENANLKRIIVAREEAKASAESTDHIVSLPEFLSRINDISRKTDVIIHELRPDTENKIRFSMRIIEDYYKFVKFLSILESLNVSIHDIEVHPYDLSKSPPLHVITFALTPREDAKPLANARLTELKQRIDKKDRRNPFQRFAYNAKRQVISSEIDLTWVYKLSGIGKIGNDRYATIENKDYNKGDRIDGMEIVSIQSDRVALTKKTPNGVEKYQLKFRRKKNDTSNPARDRRRR